MTMTMRPRVARRRPAAVVGALLLAMAACSTSATPDAVETTRVATASAATAAAAATNQYTAIAPVRLADTRARQGTTPPGRPASQGTVTVQITGRPEVAIPAGTSAVVLGVVSVDTAGPSFTTVWPSDQPRPLASNLNVDRAGATVANMVTTRVSPDGRVSLYTHAAADLVVDVYGYYTPATGAVTAGRTIAVSPARAYDSRSAGAPLAPGETRTIDLAATVPADAVAAVLNLTVTESRAAGYWTVFPPGTRPFTSNTNVTGPGQTVAVQAIVPVGANRSVQVFSQTGGHAIVDVFGYVTGPSSPASGDGLFAPLAAPVRFADTRTADNNPLGPAPSPLLPRWTVEIPVLGRAGIPAAASLIASNTTYVQATSPGYLSVAAAGTPLPPTSALNAYFPGQIVANHTTIPVGTRGVAVFSWTGGHVVVDVAGYFTGTPRPSTLPPPVNPTGRTACRSVVHFGDSTSRGLIEASLLPNPADRIDAQYARVGAENIRLEIKGARSIVETLPGDQSAYQVAQAVRASGFQGCWVLYLGTTDTANVAVAPGRVDRLARIDRMMSVVGSDPVMWVTAKTLVADGAWSDANMQRWNQALAQARATKYPGMRIFDIAPVLDPAGFWPDGIHCSTPGCKVRAQVIADALAANFPR
jgi:hypothetical protein